MAFLSGIIPFKGPGRFPDTSGHRSKPIGHFFVYPTGHMIVKLKYEHSWSKHLLSGYALRVQSERKAASSPVFLGQEQLLIRQRGGGAFLDPAAKFDQRLD